MAPRRKAGRPAKYVVDRSGRPVVGLSFHKSTRRYYATHSQPKKFFTTDFDQALMQFRQWQIGATRRVILPDYRPLIPKHDQHESVAEGWITLEEATKPIPWPAVIREQDFFDKMRELLLQKPGYVAERIGIPEVAYLAGLRPPESSLTLVEAGKLYLNKKKSITRDWASKVRNYWLEFCRLVPAKTFRDVAADDVSNYHDRVWRNCQKRSASTAYLKHRFQAVRGVLRYALKRGHDVTQIRRVLDLCGMFELPAKSGVDPKPIGVADFGALFAAADAKLKAMLVLSLNAALYAGEVAVVRLSEVDLKAGTFVADRGKTGVPRVAVLWKATINAVKQHIATEPRLAAAGESSWLFPNRAGNAHDTTSLGRLLGKLRQAAELGPSVTWSMIRDGAYTAAVEGGADVTEAQLLAGHKLPGVADHYVKRRPQMVSKACTAVAEAYGFAHCS